MQINFASFSKGLLSNVGPLSPILLVTAAVGVWFAAGSVRSTAAEMRNLQEQTSHSVSVEKIQINEASALEAAQRLSKLSPATTIAVAGKSVVISITNPEQFAEWVHAMTEVQSTIPDVQWEPVDVCIASCDGGEPAKAYVTAYSRKFKLN